LLYSFRLDLPKQGKHSLWLLLLLLLLLSSLLLLPQVKVKSDTPITHIHTAHTHQHTLQTHTPTPTPTPTQHTHTYRHTQQAVIMSNATPDETSRKRVRFNENDPKNITIAPTKKALEIFQDAVVSLLPAIRTMAEFFYNKAMKLQMSIFHLNLKKEKMTISTTIPKSARSNFNISGKHKESEARIQLINEVEECKNIYQLTLKQKIIDNMQMELQQLRTELQNTVCEGMFRLVQMFVIKEFKSDSIPEEEVHNNTLVAVNDPTITQYVFEGGIKEFVTFYRNKFHVTGMIDENDASIMSVATDISNMTDNESVIEVVSRARSRISASTTNTTTYRYVLPSHVIGPAQRLLYSIYSRTWSQYLHEYGIRTTSLLLNKAAQTILSTIATDEATNMVNSEPAVDPTLLKDIIHTEVAKATKDLRQQISKLKQSNSRSSDKNKNNQIKSNKSSKNSKNSNRGDTNNENRASTKKSGKKSGKQQTNKPPNRKPTKEKKEKKGNQKAPSKQKRGKEQADGNERGSQKRKKQNLNKSNNKNSNKKKTPSQRK
jgi:hypothetical protein